MNEIKTYKTMTELNPPNHPSSGSIVCYHGLPPYPSKDKDGIKPMMYVRISDCHVTANLHQVELDSRGAFITKLKRLIKSLQQFVSFLEILEKEDSKKPFEFPKPPTVKPSVDYESIITDLQEKLKEKDAKIKALNDQLDYIIEG